MIISNTINDFFNNFHLNELSLKTYYEKYRSELQHAEQDMQYLNDNLSTTLSKLETDTAKILKINTKLVHIVFDVRLQFLKQYDAYLKPDIFFLIGAYKQDAMIKTEEIPHVYFFIESLCQHYDDLYDTIAYHFTKLFLSHLMQLNATNEAAITYINADVSLLEEAVTLHILKSLNLTYPYTTTHDFQLIQNLETKLSEQFQTESLIKLFIENDHLETLEKYS